MQVEISGLDLFGDRASQEQITNIVHKILANSDLAQKSIDIHFIDAKEMRELNARFKNKDAVTDVLSFALPEMEKSFAHTAHMLGDVVICVPQAQKQASSYGHSVIEEVAVLVAHGLFHLLGYDHEISDEEANKQMQGEMYLLEKAGLSPELSLIGRV